jgi:hypothetical protein
VVFVGSGKATVDATGRVRAVANGTARVAAFLGAASDTSVVTVRQEAPTLAIVSSIDSIRSLGPGPYLMIVGTDANGNGIPGVRVTWATSDTSVLTLDEAGRVMAHENGVATVTAAAGQVNAAITLVVDVRGVLVVKLSTVGDGYDPDGHQITVDSTACRVEGNTLLGVADLRATVHLVSVGGLALDCHGNSEGGEVVVPTADTVRAVLEIRCAGRVAFEFYHDNAWPLRYMDEVGAVTVPSDGPIGQDMFEWSRDGE